MRSEANSVPVVYSAVLHVLAETAQRSASECRPRCWLWNSAGACWPVSQGVSHRDARSAVLLLWGYYFDP